MWKKLVATLFVLLVLAAATVAVLSQSDMIPWQTIMEFIFCRDNLSFWLYSGAGAMVFGVAAITIGSYRAHRKRAAARADDSELDWDFSSEIEEYEEDQTNEIPAAEEVDEEPEDEIGKEIEEETEERPEEQPEEQTAEAPAEPKKRRFSAKRLKKITLVALLCAVVFVVLVRVIGGPILRLRTLYTMSKKFKTPITMGKARVSLITGRGYAEDIAIASPADYGEPFTGTARRIDFKFKPHSILFGNLELELLDIWDLDLRIEIQDHGVNLETLYYNWVESERWEKGDPLPLPVEMKRIVMHNAKVSIVDSDVSRLVFDKAKIEAEDLTLFLGLPFAVKAKSSSTFGGKKSDGTLEVGGTIGPIVSMLNLDLALKGHKIDVRDLKPYIGDISRTIGGQIAGIDGKFVCKKDILDGTNLVIKSSGGEIYAIELTGPISAPVMSGSSKLVNAILVPIQKGLWIIRKIFRVDKHTDERRTDRDRDGSEKRKRSRKPLTDTIAE